MAVTNRPQRRLAMVRDDLRDRLWPLPTFAVALALVGAVALTGLDGAVDADLPPAFRSWVFGGDADAARSLLSSIATAVMTVTSLTFSLTVVTLQLASSQYSPRLLRTFTQAPYVQRTLALFLSTFVFTLAVMRSVRSADDGAGDDFVPRIAVTLAFAFTVASVVTLVVFLARLAESIRPESILRTVHDEAVATARRTLKGATTLAEHHVAPRAGAVPLRAPRSGFLVTVEVDALVRRAQEHDAVVLLSSAVGSSVVGGTTIGHAWSHDPDRLLPTEAREALQEAVDEAVEVGRERTSVDDVTFGLQQITDVALKALSPGVNDPTTAVHALGRSAAVVAVLATLPLGDVVLDDEAGVRRVVLHQPDLPDVLRQAVGHPLHYGLGDTQVTSRLYQLLGEVAEVCGTATDRRAVRAQLDAVVEADRAQDRSRADRAHLAGVARQAYAALDGPLRDR